MTASPEKRGACRATRIEPIAPKARGFPPPAAIAGAGASD